MNGATRGMMGAFAIALLLVASLTGLHGTVCRADCTTVLWYETPATDFHQALPLGNGRIGAMVFGGVNEERIVLNESSMWSGSGPRRSRPPGTATGT